MDVVKNNAAPECHSVLSWSTLIMMIPSSRWLGPAEFHLTYRTAFTRHPLQSAVLPSGSQRRSIVRSCRNSLTEVSVSGLPLLLAGSVILNTLASPLLLPLSAASALLQAEGSIASAQQLKEPLAAVAEAPSVRAEAEVNEQQQWWQQDQQVLRLQPHACIKCSCALPVAQLQPCRLAADAAVLSPMTLLQVWLELTSPMELMAYINSSQPPPAWPALDSSALSPKLRLVEFYATWCPACKVAAPGMAEVAGARVTGAYMLKFAVVLYRRPMNYMARLSRCATMTAHVCSLRSV